MIDDPERRKIFKEGGGQMTSNTKFLIDLEI